MKIKQNSSKNKKLVIIIVILCLAGAAAATFFFFKNKADQEAAKSDTSSAVDYSKPTEEQKQAGEDTQKEESPTPTPQDPGITKQTVEVTITTANQDEAGTLKVRTVISAKENGNCTVTIARNGVTSYTATADTQKQGTYYTCKGFDIAKPQLAPGNASIAITFQSASQQGSATTEMTLQ